MYGQDDQKRYPSMQAEFFERAATGLSRRESMLGFLAGLGGASILVWGGKGSKDGSLPITKGPSKPADVGPRGRI
jgi:photosystem I subunit 6